MEIDVTKLNIGDKIIHRDKGEITVLGIHPHCGDYLIVNDGPWVYLKYCHIKDDEDYYLKLSTAIKESYDKIKDKIPPPL